MSEEGAEEVQSSSSCDVQGENNTGQPKKSVCLRVIASAGFIIACLAMLVSYVQSKRLNNELSLMESEIWSLKRKIVSEVKSFDSNMAQIENNMATYEKALVVAELRRIYSTVKDISRRYPDKVKDYADKVNENITMLITDLDNEALPEAAVSNVHGFSPKVSEPVAPPVQMEEPAPTEGSPHGNIDEMFNEMMKEGSSEHSEFDHSENEGHEMFQGSHPFGDLDVVPDWKKDDGHNEGHMPELIPDEDHPDEDHPAGHDEEHAGDEI